MYEMNAFTYTDRKHKPYYGENRNLFMLQGT